MTPTTAAIIRELTEKADSLRDSIAGGQCGDWVEYKAQVGKRKGYLEAIGIAIERDKSDAEDE